MSANPDTKKCVGIKIVSPRQGHLGKMCQHLAVVGTCRQHVGNFISQAHAAVMNMLHTAEIDVADSVKPSDTKVFLSDVAWAICSTYHTVLKPHQMQQYLDKTCSLLVDILFIADWKKIGEDRQLLTNRNTNCENKGRIDYDYQVWLENTHME
jgi:hypothetical protein